MATSDSISWIHNQFRRAVSDLVAAWGSQLGGFTNAAQCRNTEGAPNITGRLAYLLDYFLTEVQETPVGAVVEYPLALAFETQSPDAVVERRIIWYGDFAAAIAGDRLHRTTIPRSASSLRAGHKAYTTVFMSEWTAIEKKVEAHGDQKDPQRLPLVIPMAEARKSLHGRGCAYDQGQQREVRCLYFDHPFAEKDKGGVLPRSRRDVGAGVGELASVSAYLRGLLC